MMEADVKSRDERQIADLLGRARALAEPVLRESVGALPPRMRQIAGYHLGWWDKYGSALFGDGGKAVRPALVLAAARAAGGAEPVAARAAAVVELIHNFTLLHDDVMDQDTRRRRRPTAWSVFGTSDAILAGDALQAAAGRLLAEDSNPAAAPAAARLAQCVIELCEGQSADCAFENRVDVTVAECLVMAEAKTGALLGCSCALGALYAGAPAELVDGLDSFGRKLGVAFQLIDDLLGIWGDPAMTGKPVGADLVARKKSLPVVAALTSGTQAGRALAGLYEPGRPLQYAEVPHAAALVEQAGGRAWARRQAESRITEALADLTRLIPDPAAAADLLALADLITDRDR
jgi:geranylgeranyl diphosphate synthase type I